METATTTEAPVKTTSDAGGMKRAIFDKCLDCCAYERARVDECTYRGCPLHRWRNRKARKETGTARKGERADAAAKGVKVKQPGMKKAIQLKCLDCCCNQRGEVELCPTEGCSLHPFRNAKARKLRKAMLAGATAEELAALEAQEAAAEAAGTATDDTDEEDDGLDADQYGEVPPNSSEEVHGAPGPCCAACGTEMEDGTCPHCSKG